MPWKLECKAIDYLLGSVFRRENRPQPFNRFQEIEGNPYDSGFEEPTKHEVTLNLSLGSFFEWKQFPLFPINTLKHIMVSMVCITPKLLTEMCPLAVLQLIWDVYTCQDYQPHETWLLSALS